jgi:hypothetical protein
MTTGNAGLGAVSGERVFTMIPMLEQKAGGGNRKFSTRKFSGDFSFGKNAGGKSYLRVTGPSGGRTS